MLLLTLPLLTFLMLTLLLLTLLLLTFLLLMLLVDIPLVGAPLVGTPCGHSSCWHSLWTFVLLTFVVLILLLLTLLLLTFLLLMLLLLTFLLLMLLLLTFLLLTLLLLTLLLLTFLLLMLFCWCAHLGFSPWVTLASTTMKRGKDYWALKTSSSYSPCKWPANEFQDNPETQIDTSTCASLLVCHATKNSHANLHWSWLAALLPKMMHCENTENPFKRCLVMFRISSSCLEVEYSIQWDTSVSVWWDLA